MRRIIAFALVTPLLAAGCGLSGSAEDRAVTDAGAKAGRVGKALYGHGRWTAQDMGRRAARLRDVEVMRVSGTSTGDRDGVRVVIRVPGTGYEGWPAEQVTVRRCFELGFSPRTEWGDEPRGVRCPPGTPLAFGPWPKAPEIPGAELEKALPRVPRNGAVDEAAVRRAVASLRLDPAIRTEVGSRDGVVGVSLRVKPSRGEAESCVFGRVAPGGTRVWTPPRVQRMPGEAGCGVGGAISPLPPPH